MADNTTRALQQEPSIRLFRNDFLEALTHVHPIVPLLFWSPVVAWLLWRSVFVHALPAPGLLEQAEAGAALLVVGSRGLGSVKGILLGSVSRTVVERSPIPVVVVPHV